ncbi:prepilin-type N-terminal cleavage/methylation domain-containing protein [Puniceicoccus vermicola]|uniref:Prepilin-type N-terminal cleavage/methylation domain-containing protein n=1 Tax=Puniceicoccus vermicola TaxID=388746 RepID=A0A7X1B0I0_9BACT|nr:prepilin-type N-terminal cleavage/methylation domain-containing protein [Puniceicoccus vermicola]
MNRSPRPWVKVCPIPRIFPLRSSLSRDGFTLIELLAVIAILGVLTSILIPAIGSIRSGAKSSQCRSNLRQIHGGVILYATENEGWLPPNEDDRGHGAWWKQIYPAYIDGPGVFLCPADETEGISDENADLAWNGKLSYGAMGNDDPYAKQGVMDKKLSMFSEPSISVMLVDAHREGRQLAKSWFYNWPRYSPDIVPAHGDKVNLAFVDGHVEDLSVEEIEQRFDEDRIRISYGGMPSRTEKLTR